MGANLPMYVNCFFSIKQRLGWVLLCCLPSECCKVGQDKCWAVSSPPSDVPYCTCKLLIFKISIVRNFLFRGVSTHAHACTQNVNKKICFFKKLSKGTQPQLQVAPGHTVLLLCEGPAVLQAPTDVPGRVVKEKGLFWECFQRCLRWYICHRMWTVTYCSSVSLLFMHHLISLLEVIGLLMPKKK